MRGIGPLLYVGDSLLPAVLYSVCRRDMAR